MGISSSAPWLKYYGDTPHHLDYPSKTIYEMVKAAADQFPKNDAYEFMGKKTTFAQFMQKIDNVARAFLALGIHKATASPSVCQTARRRSARSTRSTASARSAT